MITAPSTSAIAAAAQSTGGLGPPVQKAASATHAANPATPSPSDQKLQQARDALVKLKAVRGSAQASRSDAARAKLEALKQRLKMLMMMGGDPKTVARQAAQIAKEIGQAAKEYAAAGGGASAATAAQTPAMPPAAAASPDTANPAAPGDDRADDSLAAADAAAGAETPTPGAAPDSPKTDPASPAKPGTKTVAAPGLSAPDPVIAEAKTLAARAKALLKAAIERAKREHADPAELKDDQDKMNVAEKDIDDAARTVSAAADTSASYSASGEGVAAQPSDGAPTLSVQA